MTLQYTQKGGFEEIVFTPEWGDESREHWLTRAGFQMINAENDGFESGEGEGYTAKVYMRSNVASHSYCAMVLFSGYDIVDAILAPTPADLLALRVALAPLILTGLRMQLDELKEALGTLTGERK